MGMIWEEYGVGRDPTTDNFGQMSGGFQKPFVVRKV